MMTFPNNLPSKISTNDIPHFHIQILYAHSLIRATVLKNCLFDEDRTNIKVLMNNQFWLVITHKNIINQI